MAKKKKKKKMDGQELWIVERGLKEVKEKKKNTIAARLFPIFLSPPPPLPFPFSFLPSLPCPKLLCMSLQRIVKMKRREKKLQTEHMKKRGA